MRRSSALLVVLLIAGCRPKHALVEDLDAKRDLLEWTLREVSGTRHGDRCDALLVFGNIDVALRFRVGSPTVLIEGQWSQGPGIAPAPNPVVARSVTFLGGQNGPPSIGGTFDLIDAAGHARYRVRLPVTVLARPAGSYARRATSAG